MKTFATRYPFLFAVAVTLGGLLCLLVPFWLPGLPLAAQLLLGRAAICVLAAGLLTRLGWWREAGFARPASWRILLPYLPLILVVLLVVVTAVGGAGIQVTDPALILLGLVVYLAGGFFEEAIFRGLTLRALRPGGLVRAAILSALIFAPTHLLNMTQGADPGATALQVVVALLAGFAFVAPLAYTGNIWPLVFVHFLNNFAGYLAKGTFAETKSPTISDILGNVIIFGLLAVYGYWLLRRAQRMPGRLASSRTEPAPVTEGTD